MATIISNPNQIKNHPVNTSTAKYHWSFSKSSRFKEPRSYSNTIGCEGNLSSFSKNAVGFGYGDRSAIFNGINQDQPSSCQYNIPSSFKNNKEHRGYSFGNNRDKLKFGNYLQLNEETPSPLTYSKDGNTLNNSRCYSMRPKTAYPKDCIFYLIIRFYSQRFRAKEM
jgi:hypothetical protein